MAQASDPGSNPERKLDAEYYWDFVTFSVKGSLFRVPAHRFFEESPWFSSKYLSLCDADGPNNDDVTIEFDVDVATFRIFLKALYPRKRNTNAVTRLAADEWRLVLTLSTKWFFRDLRKQSIEALSKAGLDVFTRIEMAKGHGISPWLLTAYREIIRKNDPITLKDAERLGIQNTLHLYDLRVKSRIPKNARDPDFLDPAILDVFKNEFSRIDEIEAKHEGSKPKRADYSPKSSQVEPIFSKLATAHDKRLATNDPGDCAQVSKRPRASGR